VLDLTGPAIEVRAADGSDDALATAARGVPRGRQREGTYNEREGA
jgi:hypothetical protein